MKPYTNYNHKLGERPTWDAVVAAAAAGREACRRGLHGEIVEVTVRRVAYAAFGRRRPIGERYCVRCGDVATDDGRARDGVA